MFRQWAESRNLGLPTSIVTLFLRDGTLYMVAIMALDLSQLFLFVPRSDAPYVQPLAQVLPSVAICRLILNLRQCNKDKENSQWQTNGSSRASPMLFQALRDGMSNMGETFDNMEDEERDDSDDPTALVHAGGHEVPSTFSGSLKLVVSQF
ncbi:uncharacterized protein PHACADRAFT_191503 [Phanerochaete carnosa HHB-10118-sp]|uniref:Uncharacterized protein n=1 Tax=Phanerochaete carnosa (strain HHB-10118-sp) TaxID=650164 RepID=K5WIH7_PHACS|nr:uncharacterized protein PHACADRAFT_191503 [Phanerochaete carnosa HHB-10118-sp]EKM59185.1 hypothetical protein PHACADRAFT_191503 [Phanerochaete carnosa HHB-10118-sp]